MSSSVELVKLSSLSQNSKSKSNLNLSPTGCPKQNWDFKFLLDIGHPVILQYIISKVREAFKNLSNLGNPITNVVINKLFVGQEATVVSMEGMSRVSIWTIKTIYLWGFHCLQYLWKNISFDPQQCLNCPWPCGPRTIKALPRVSWYIHNKVLGKPRDFIFPYILRQWYHHRYI